MNGNADENNTRAMTVAAGASLVRASLKSHSFTPSPLPGIQFDKNIRFTRRTAYKGSELTNISLAGF